MLDIEKRLINKTIETYCSIDNEIIFVFEEDVKLISDAEKVIDFYLSPAHLDLEKAAVIINLLLSIRVRYEDYENHFRDVTLYDIYFWKGLDTSKHKEYSSTLLMAALATKNFYYMKTLINSGYISQCGYKLYPEKEEMVTFIKEFLDFVIQDDFDLCINHLYYLTQLAKYAEYDEFMEDLSWHLINIKPEAFVNFIERLYNTDKEFYKEIVKAKELKMDSYYYHEVLIFALQKYENKDFIKVEYYSSSLYTIYNFFIVLTVKDKSLLTEELLTPYYYKLMTYSYSDDLTFIDGHDLFTIAASYFNRSMIKTLNPEYNDLREFMEDGMDEFSKHNKMNPALKKKLEDMSVDYLFKEIFPKRKPYDFAFEVNEYDLAFNHKNHEFVNHFLNLYQDKKIYVNAFNKYLKK